MSVTVLFASAILYSLATTGVLLVVGAFLLFVVTSGAAASAALAATALVVLAVAHTALFAVLRRTDLPRPGTTAALLTASVVLGLLQTALMYLWFDVGRGGGPLFAAGLQGAAVALALSLSRGRGIGWAAAAAALAVASLLRLLVTGGLDTASPHLEVHDRPAAATAPPHEVAAPDATAETPPHSSL
ncbi:hypothetical protein Q8791_11440 [Nocardiopsis sp. CT-R113]|uniref:Integral membrane protein n=1 Tax=Nocardiopsis codii TaxID=3065942 RepID=A0ABU7K6F0_9ACTN|nr:hypothetical protein [Nocardiopsis sp. CT-R113]MEE2037832.1 hypothetical protein [Nocardiopsis sp. CT-R113]